MYQPIYPEYLPDMPMMPVMMARNGRMMYPMMNPYYMNMMPVMRPHSNGSAAAQVPGEGPPQMRKLFIGGLNHETTDEQLRVYFGQWGTVVDSIVIRDPNTKQSRGFGFVTFATIAMAENAMANRPHSVGGKTVDSKRAIPREQMTPMFPPPFFDCEPQTGCKLTISGLHWETHTVECLRIYFERFGALDQVEIVGHPRGYGFVVFERAEDAEKCAAHRNGRHTVAEKRLDARMWYPSPPHMMWKRRAPPPQLIDEFAAMSMDDPRRFMTPTYPCYMMQPGMGGMMEGGGLPYEEDSSYGDNGDTTTEDERGEGDVDEQAESSSSGSAADDASPRKNSA